MHPFSGILPIPEKACKPNDKLLKGVGDYPFPFV